MANPILRMACCAILASSALVLAAPGQAHPGASAAGERMNKALGLSEAQQAALKEARRDAMASHRQARAEGGDRSELRQQHAAQMREVYADILTPEQLQKLADRREAGRARQRAGLTEHLDLHPDQVDAVRGILAEARREGAQGAEGDRQQRRAALREQLAGVLTPAQLERFDAMHSGRREAGLDRMMQRLSQRLELHSSQVDPVREVFERSFAEMQEQGRRLRTEHAGVSPDRAALRQAMAAERERIQAETREQLSAILTPAQLETFDGLRHDHRGRKGGWQGRERARS